MKKETKRNIYVKPEINVFQVKSLQMIATSSSIDTYNDGGDLDI